MAETSILSCPVCLDPFFGQPVHQTVCGHAVCDSCAKTLVAQEHRCPVCREPSPAPRVNFSMTAAFGETACAKEVVVAPCCGECQPATRLQHYSRQCPNEEVLCPSGCGAKVKHRDLEQHSMSCRRFKVPCLVGCPPAARRPESNVSDVALCDGLHARQSVLVSSRVCCRMRLPPRSAHSHVRSNQFWEFVYSQEALCFREEVVMFSTTLETVMPPSLRIAGQSIITSAERPQLQLVKPKDATSLHIQMVANSSNTVSTDWLMPLLNQHGWLHLTVRVATFTSSTRLDRIALVAEESDSDNDDGGYYLDVRKRFRHNVWQWDEIPSFACVPAALATSANPLPLCEFIPYLSRAKAPVIVDICVHSIEIREQSLAGILPLWHGEDEFMIKIGSGAPCERATMFEYLPVRFLESNRIADDTPRWFRLVLCKKPCVLSMNLMAVFDDGSCSAVPETVRITRDRFTTNWPSQIIHRYTISNLNHVAAAFAQDNSMPDDNAAGSADGPTSWPDPAEPAAKRVRWGP